MMTESLIAEMEAAEREIAKQSPVLSPEQRVQQRRAMWALPLDVRIARSNARKREPNL